MSDGILFDGSSTEPDNLPSVIFQALGRASMCWDSPEGAGEFHSDCCADLGKEVLHYLDLNYVERAKPSGAIRRFKLVRLEDESGVSGTGIVAHGVEFPDGACAMRWATGTASTAVYASITDVVTIHGHGGKTLIEWMD